MLETVIKTVFGIYLFVMAVVDMKSRYLSVKILAFGGMLCIMSAFITTTVIWQSMAGGLLTGAVFVILSLLTRGQIGMADGIVLCMTGIVSGTAGNLAIIAWALILVAIVSTVLVLIKRLGRRSRIPFIPFIFAGYVLRCVV